MNYEGKYIKFVEFLVVTTKTRVFDILNKDTHCIIGTIRWYGPWRKYSFFPEPNTVFESQCLSDITKFLNDLMLERKLVKQKIKTN